MDYKETFNNFYNSVSAYQKNLAQPVEQPRTTRNAMGQMMKITRQDPERGYKLQRDFQTLQQTPGSEYYAPYTQPTNRAVNNLKEMGIDVSNINDDWYANNAYLQTFYTPTDTTNNPSKPGKNATMEQNAGYQYYQVYQAKEDTDKAKQESAALKEELGYYAKSPLNYSDEEIIGMIDWGKYPTLAKMNETAARGTPMQLNEAVDQATEDWMYGVLWASRNDGGTGSSWKDMAMSANGEGNVWQDNPEISAKRNWNDKDTYSIYELGMTMTDEGAYFGVYDVDRPTLDRIRREIDPNDATSVKMFQNLEKRFEATEQLKDDSARMKEDIDTLLQYYDDPETIISIIKDDSSYSGLFALDDSIKNGAKGKTLIQTTSAIPYRWDKTEQYIRHECGIKADQKDAQSSLMAMRSLFETSEGSTPKWMRVFANSGTPSIGLQMLFENELANKSSVPSYVANHEMVGDIKPHVPEVQSTEPDMSGAAQAVGSTDNGVNGTEIADYDLSVDAEGRVPETTPRVEAPDAAQDVLSTSSDVSEGNELDVASAVPNREGDVMSPSAGVAPPELEVDQPDTTEIAIAKARAEAYNNIAMPVNKIGTEEEKLAIKTGKTDFAKDTNEFIDLGADIVSKGVVGPVVSGVVNSQVGEYYLGGVRTIIDYEEHQGSRETNIAYRDKLTDELSELRGRAGLYEGDELNDSEKERLEALTTSEEWPYYRDILSHPELAEESQYNRDQYDKALLYLYQNVMDEDNQDYGYGYMNTVRPQAEHLFEIANRPRYESVPLGLEDIGEVPEALSAEDWERYFTIKDKIAELDGKIAEDDAWLAENEAAYKSSLSDRNSLQDMVTSAGREGYVDKDILDKVDFFARAVRSNVKHQVRPYSLYDTMVLGGYMDEESAAYESSLTEQDDLKAIQILDDSIQYMDAIGVPVSSEDRKNAEKLKRELQRESMEAHYTALDGAPDFAEGVAAGRKKAEEDARWQAVKSGEINDPGAAHHDTMLLLAAADGGEHYADSRENAWIYASSIPATSQSVMSHNNVYLVDNLTQKNVDRYFYLYNQSPEEAAKYFAFIKDPVEGGELFVRSEQAKQDTIKEAASSSVVGAVVMTGASVLMKPVGVLTSIVGRASGIDNPHHPVYMFDNHVNVMRSGSKEFVTGLFGENSFFGKLMGRGYDVGVALLDYAAAKFVAGGMFPSSVSGAPAIAVKTKDIATSAVLAMETSDATFHKVLIETGDVDKANIMGAAGFVTDFVTHSVMISGLHKAFQANPSGTTSALKRYFLTSFENMGAAGVSTFASEAVSEGIERVALGDDSTFAKRKKHYMDDLDYTEARAEQMAEQDMWHDLCDATSNAVLNSWLRTTVAFGVGEFQRKGGVKQLSKDLKELGKSAKNAAIRARNYYKPQEGEALYFDAENGGTVVDANGNPIVNISGNLGDGTTPEAAFTDSGVSVPTEAGTITNTNVNTSAYPAPVAEMVANTPVATDFKPVSYTDSAFLMGSYSSNPTATAVVVSSTLGGDSAAQAAGQKFVGKIAKEPHLAANAMNSLVLNGANRQDLTYAILTKGAGNAALDAAVKKVANGERLTPPDVNAISAGIAEDRKANPAKFERSFKSAVRANMISNRTLANLVKTGGDKKIKDAQTVADNAKAVAKTAQKNAEKAENSLDAAGKVLERAGAEYDPSNGDTATALQNATQQVLAAADQNEQAQQVAEDTQRKAEQAQKEADSVATEVLTEARQQATAEVDQEMQEQEITSYNDSIASNPPIVGFGRNIQVYNTEGNPVTITGVYDYMRPHRGTVGGVVYTTADGGLVMEDTGLNRIGERLAPLPGAVNTNNLAGEERTAYYAAMNDIESRSDTRARPDENKRPYVYFPHSFEVDINGQPVQMIGIAGVERNGSYEDIVLMDRNGNKYSTNDPALDLFEYNDFVQDSFDTVSNNLPVVENVPRIQVTEENVNGEAQTGQTGLPVQGNVGEGNNAGQLAEPLERDVRLGDNSDAGDRPEARDVGGVQADLPGNEGQGDSRRAAVLRNLITANIPVDENGNPKTVTDPRLHVEQDYGRFSASLDAARKDNPNGLFVDPQSTEELAEKGAITLLSENGMAGVAVGTKGEYKGNIFGVFNDPRSPEHGVMPYLMIHAIANGGVKLDCYDGFLSKQYAKFGFVPVARVPWNSIFHRTIDPKTGLITWDDGWNYERHGEPDVIVWMHNGDSPETVAQRYGSIGKEKGGYDYFKPEYFDNLPVFTDSLDENGNPIEGEDGYSKALRYRDGLLNSRDRGNGLVITHGLTVDQFKDALAHEGIAAPSIGISREGVKSGVYTYGRESVKENGEWRYKGPVVILFNENTIDPKADERNQLFSGDAYTPTFPSGIKTVDNDYVNEKTGEIYSRDDIVRMMYESSPDAAVITRRYGSLDEMKEDSGRLVEYMSDLHDRTLENTDLELAANELYDSLPQAEQEKLESKAAAERLRLATTTGKVSTINGAELLADTLAENVRDIYKEGMTPAEMQQGLKTLDIEATEEAAGKYLETADRVFYAVTDFLEAKPRRFVGTDEFRGVIVPEDEPELIRMLEERGIPYLTHNHKNVQQQAETLMRTLNDAAQTPLDDNGNPILPTRESSTPSDVSEAPSQEAPTQPDVNDKGESLASGLNRIINGQGLSLEDHPGIPQMKDLVDMAGRHVGYTLKDRDGNDRIAIKEGGSLDTQTVRDILKAEGFTLDKRNGEWVLKPSAPKQNSDIKAFRGSTPQTPTQAHSAKVKKTLQSPQRILKSFIDRLEIGNYVGSNDFGSLPASVRGYFAGHASLVAVKDKDIGSLVVGFHEGGHYLAKLLGMAANQLMVDNLTMEEPEFASHYDQTELKDEAFAEWFWRYLESDDRARAFAGDDFVDEFERQLVRHPGANRAVTEAKQEYRRWVNATTEDRLQAKIRHENEPSAKSFKQQVRTLINEVIDSTSIAQDVDDFVGSGGTLRQQALFANHSQKRAVTNLTDSLTDANGTIVGPGLSEAMFDAGFKFTDKNLHTFEEYWLLQHSLERDDQNKPVFGDMSVAEREVRIAEILREHPEFEAVENALQEWRTSFLQNWMVDTGYWPQEFLDHLNEINPHYAPTFRVRGRESQQNMSAFGKAGKKYTLHSAVGGSEDIYSPMYSLIGMVDQITSMVANNQTAQEFDRLYQQNEGMGVFGRLIPDDPTSDSYVPDNNPNSRQKQLMDLLNGKVSDDVMSQVLEITKSNPSVNGKNSGQNILRVQRSDGSVVRYEIDNPELYKLLSGVQASSGIKILQLVGKLTRTMSMLTTGSNPLFTARNVVRDLQTSVNYGTWASNYLTAIPKWLRSAFEVATKSDTFKQYEALGGGGWQRIQQGDSKSLKGIANEMFGDDKSNVGKTAKWLGKKLWNTVTASWLNEVAEQASRFAEYRYGKHNLNTPEGRQEAFQAAQDVTVDFSRNGNAELAYVLKKLVPFFNASAQGAYRTARQFTKAERDMAGKRVLKNVVNTAIMSALGAGLIMMFGDEEDKEEFGMLSDGVKANHFILPNPLAGPGEPPFIRIPIAQDPLSYAVHNAVTNALWGGYDDDFAISLAATADVILDNMNPLGSSIFQPFIDVSHNRTWYGSAIVRNSQADWTDKASQFNEDTPYLFKALGNLFGVSPEVVEYIATQYTGFIGAMAIPALSQKSDGGLGGLKAIGDSVVKKWTTDPAYSNDVTKNFYAMEGNFSTIVGEAKAGKPQGLLLRRLSQEETDQAYEEARAMTTKGGIIYETKELINDTNKQIDEINGNPSLTDDQKYELTRNLRIDMLKKVEVANAEMRAYEKKYITGETLLDRTLGAAQKRVETGKVAHVKTPVEEMPEMFQTDAESNTPYMQRVMSVYDGSGEGSQKSAALPHPQKTFELTLANGLTEEYEITDEKEWERYTNIYKEEYSRYVMASEKGKNWDKLSEKDQYSLLKSAHRSANDKMKQAYARDHGIKLKK